MIIQTKFGEGDVVQTQVRYAHKKVCETCGAIRVDKTNIELEQGVIKEVFFQYVNGLIQNEEYYVALESGRGEYCSSKELTLITRAPIIGFEDK